MFHGPLGEILLRILDHPLGVWINIRSEVDTFNIFIFIFILQLGSVFIVYLLVIVHPLCAGLGLSTLHGLLIIDMIGVVHLPAPLIYLWPKCWGLFLFQAFDFLILFAIPEEIFSVRAQIVKLLVQVTDLLVRKTECWSIYQTFNRIQLINNQCLSI